jgi:hypothetical protein
MILCSISLGLLALSYTSGASRILEQYGPYSVPGSAGYSFPASQIQHTIFDFRERYHTYDPKQTTSDDQCHETAMGKFIRFAKGS